MIDIEKITEKQFARHFVIALIIFGCIGLALCCFVGAVSAYDQPSQDGDGYYLISTVSNLQWFAEQVNAGNIQYKAKLVNNIDLNSISSWVPIGTSSKMYSGVFNGNGYKISNFHYTGSESNYGFFGYVNGATISNLGMENVNIYSSGTVVGGLIGNSDYSSSSSPTRISNCWVTGSVACSRYAGGIAGYLIYGVVSNCYVSAAISADDWGCVGGITPFSRVITINNCYVTGTIAAEGEQNGGFVGFIVPSTSQITGDSYIYSSVCLATLSGGSTIGKIWGEYITSYGSGTITGSNNYAINGGSSASSKNGLSKTAAEIQAVGGTFFTTTSNWGSYPWDFTNVWYWDNSVNLPKLIVFNPPYPSITAITLTSTTPAEIGSTVSVTATLENTPISDSGTVTFYTSTTPASVSSWVSVGSQQISAQSATGVISHSFTGSDTAGTYYVKAILSDTTQSVIYDSYTDGAITNVFFILQYADPIPNTPGGPLQPISIPYTITLTASCSNEITVASYVWQLQTGGNWGNVSTGQQYTPSITTPGNHVYRFLAIGKNGHVIPSTSITVNAGYAPSAVITQPTTGTQIEPGQQLDLEATIGGTAGTYTWDFGNGVSSHGTNTGTVDSQSQSITSYVVYNQQKGTREITLTVSNVYGTTAVYKIYIENGKGTLRPAAVSTIKPVDSSGIYNLINDSKPTSYENQMPNLSAMVTDVTKPMTSIIGEWFYLVLFAVPYIILFIRQKNILIPSILGVLFAAWLLVFLPGAAMKAAIGILILCVAGGIIGLYVKRQS